MKLAAVLMMSVGVCSAQGLDDLFQGMAGPSSPGLAVMVRQNGRTVYQRGFGKGIDARSNFRLASFTKQFTAMATMLLVHDGKLRYETRLGEIFPEFPEWGRGIQVKHLLMHTSGLPDYEELMEGGSWSATRQISDAEALALIERAGKPKFAAGDKWEYSNSGYVLLGLIAAKVSGKSFPEVLRERIFIPLKMDRTVAFVNGTNTVPGRVYGHGKRGDAFVETDQSSTSATLGDGGVYSNLEDLAKWDEALARYTLLPKREMDRAYEGDHYGFGWFLEPYRGHVRRYHTGTTVGFRTVIQRLPEAKLTVVILANRSDLDVEALSLKVLDRMLKN